MLELQNVSFQVDAEGAEKEISIMQRQRCRLQNMHSLAAKQKKWN